MAVVSATAVPTASVLSDSRRLRKSKVARDMPSSMIGPISGEISIAPMMTATEFCSRPSVAMPHAITVMKA